MNGKQWLGVGGLFVAAVLLHFAAEAWWKALLILAAALILDIAVDFVFTKWEKARGDID